MKGDYKKQATTVRLVALILSAFLTSVNQIFYDWVIAMGTFIACTILILAVVSGKSAVPNGHNFARDFRIDSECWLWVGAVPCTMCSKKLSEAGWTTSMILANRYYGIILLSFFATFDIFFKYFSGNISWIIAVTAVGVMLRLNLLQIGIQYCSPLVVMVSL
ncbi:hypothetical protein [Lysinibacillus xylanilyticus]|uniref:Uncharacterized protein n=1 Tax=Lysinibacillus xylanilyticus TaxID=582475 RepID=A0A2M9QBW5_9BACI|nr:hypothetical protein [Lysinibacillus xylanilyticus]PJO45566.1 hypothetical protein CWD94_00470 [Lysinibacillus xylanilyticus]